MCVCACVCMCNNSIILRYPQTIYHTMQTWDMEEIRKNLKTKEQFMILLPTFKCYEAQGIQLLLGKPIYYPNENVTIEDVCVTIR